MNGCKQYLGTKKGEKVKLIDNPANLAAQNINSQKGKEIDFLSYCKLPEAYKEGRFELWIRFEGEDSFKACDGHTYTFDRTGEGVYYLDFFMSGFDASSTPEYKVTAIADFEITE